MMTNLAPKMANLAPFLEPSWLIEAILEGILTKTVKKQKTLKKQMVFESFWVVRRVHLELFGGHVGLCWRILALRAGILSELGNMMQDAATS